VAELPRPAFPTALGIFRQVEKPTYEDLLTAQIDSAIARNGPGDLSRLLNAGTTWTVD
jgi:2-oxoglutarate ferredoxin oxidoreductase subunit beta